MKKKLTTSLLAICIAIVTALTFSACEASSIGVNEYLSGVKEIGITYFAKHDSYDNFADITATMKSEKNVKSSIELEHLKSEGDTALTKETFEDSVTNQQTSVFSAKRIDGTLFLKIESNVTEKGVSYDVDENYKLVAEQIDTVEYEVLEFGRENGALTDEGYYLRRYAYNKDGGEIVDEEKEYVKYSNQDTYETAVTSLIEYFNAEVINDGFYMSDSSGIFTLFSSLFKYFKDGNAFGLELSNPSLFFEDNGEYGFTNITAKVRMTNGGDYVGNMEGSYETSDSKSNYKQEVKIVNSSSLVSIQAPYDGYTENFLLMINNGSKDIIERICIEMNIM